VRRPPAGPRGTYYTNPYAPADCPAARNAGLRVYAHAFAISNGNGGSASPAAQADYLVNFLRSSGVPPLPETEVDTEYRPGIDRFRAGSGAVRGDLEDTGKRGDHW
jgi:hypothetical protein